MAQDDEPQTGAPLRLVAPTPTPDRDEAAAPAGIGAAPLGPLDPSWSDALPKGETPLPRDMWLGTSRAILRALLGQLGPTDSPALRAVAHRLLLSGAAAPEGGDPPDGPSLVVLRAEALERLGDIAGAETVLDNFPADKSGETADRLRIELAFAGNDAADGCRRVAAGLTRYQNVWWDQANIACQLVSGARDKAALALDVMHDRDATPDPLFDTLVAAATGGRGVKLDKHATLTPLRAALWALSKRPLPAEVIASMDGATAAAFAGSGEAVQNRLPAAERAAALGAWPPDRLAALYGKYNGGDAEGGNVLTGPKMAETAMGRALLFATAAQDGNAAQRLQALVQYLAAAQQHSLYFAAAQIAAPIVAAIGPNGAAKDAAPIVIRALIAADREQDIGPWLALLDAPATDPLVTAVHAIDGTRPDDRAAAELLAALALRAKDLSGAIGIYLTLLSEFGTALTATELSGQMAPAHRAALPSAAVWLDLRRAAAGHRLGETILASIVVAQDGAQLTTEPVALQRAIGALRAVGFDGEARRLAREAAVAAGL